jgi:hypothetical protein
MYYHEFLLLLEVSHSYFLYGKPPPTNKKLFVPGTTEQYETLLGPLLGDISLQQVMIKQYVCGTHLLGKNYLLVKGIP